MPRTNGISLLLLGSFLATGFCQSSGQNHPLVAGYERFHSEAPSIEGGRILFNELGCVNCHAHPTGLPAKMGPTLAGVAERIYPYWIQAFLKNPSSTKPGTTMPQMHLADEEVVSVTHFLASLKPKKKTPNAFKFVNAKRGSQLYHEIGCVACHEPSMGLESKAGGSNSESVTSEQSPYPYLKEKYDIHSLSAFLYKPHDSRPQGRMPQFKLDKEDGGDLAAYLLDYANGDSTDYPKIQSIEIESTLTQRGKAIVASKNCVACHDSPKSEHLARKRRTKINPGKPTPSSHPNYALSEIQQDSINLFIANAPKALPALTHLETLNCVACHDRDGIGGPDTARMAYFTGDADLGDLGRLPPPLTDAGRKLQRKWLRAAINGEKQVRPYLKVQMPDFGRATLGLPNLLISEDKAPRVNRSPKSNSEAGRRLLGTQGGLNCITCHGWDDRQSLGIQALNLSNLSERLQIDWLHEYLIDPSSHRPYTLMPSFWPGGIASNQEILQGKTHAQIAAIYAFAKKGSGLPEGFPEESSTTYEIVPTDRPVVQRAFMEDIGTHALLVGFPERIHFAFDGKSGQPAMMWKGRFFDAYRTWFSRYPEFEKPLGKEVIHWANTDSSNDSHYRGYRFDQNGIPEFLVELEGAILYEQLQPVKGESGRQMVKRTVQYTRESQWKDPRLIHPKEVKVTEVETNDPMTRTFIYQW